ncbi:hypothetical protein HMPREF9264_0495 [Lactobacillus delbrueckii subsp. bulgaricus PB2003/044-T3-4]|nr:hypothetical protein HMPREF9264_0495 [Lactobacillus delbrueckii subsp. bulgaricus PB2003/044-T3-4]
MYSRGSPPLAWGILIDLKHENKLVRITPTCVGNTEDQKVE